MRQLNHSAVAAGLMAAALMATGCDGKGWSSPFGKRASTDSASGAAADDEAGYTIVLYVLNDPATHVRDAENFKKTLADKVGWRGLYVVHKAGRSELFWGKYSSYEDAEKNLSKAKAYRSRNGIPVFARSMVVPLPGKDIGPQKWNLRQVDAEYSLLVAVFKDDPDKNYVGRRRFAVEYCRRLRENNYDAYFHHGKVSSHVTIGRFGKEAVRVRKTSRGPQSEVLDPAVKALQSDFPHLAVNGSGVNDIIRDRKTGKMIRIPRKTHLIHVPRSQGDDGG